jgi:type I restriction enzyme S subunit
METELGPIPEIWSVLPLGEIVDLRRGHDLTWRDRRRGDVPVMGSAGENGRHNMALAAGPGVVLGRSGASFGQAHFCEVDYWPHNPALYVTDFRGTDPRFIFYYLSAVDFTRHNTGGAQQSLNRNFIYPIKCALPPPAEQRAIVRALRDVEGLIDALDALIAKKRDVKQAAMQQLLTGRTRLPGYESPWADEKLGSLLRYEQPTKYLVSSSDYSGGGGVPVLTAGKSFLLGYTTEAHGIYDRGATILFDDFTTASQWVSFPFKVKSSACKMLTLRSDNASLRYVFEQMQMLRYEPADHKRHWISTFASMTVPAPSADEQQAVANVLSDMDSEIEALVAERDKMRLVKQGMMQELLSGRVRLV